MIDVISIPQVDGAVRYVALAAGDARAVRRNRALLDHVHALACLEVGGDGAVFWAWPFGCANTPAGKAAIRAHLGARPR